MSQAAYEAGPLLARTEVVDEVSPTLPRVESLRREVFDRSPLGIVESDLDRRVRYANQAALAMIGATEYQGLSLDQVFSDDDSKNTVRQQIEERREGLIGNYRAY